MQVTPPAESQNYGFMFRLGLGSLTKIKDHVKACYLGIEERYVLKSDFLKVATKRNIFASKKTCVELLQIENETDTLRITTEECIELIKKVLKLKEVKADVRKAIIIVVNSCKSTAVLKDKLLDALKVNLELTSVGEDKLVTFLENDPVFSLLTEVPYFKLKTYVYMFLKYTQAKKELQECFQSQYKSILKKDSNSIGIPFVAFYEKACSILEPYTHKDLIKELQITYIQLKYSDHQNKKKQKVDALGAPVVVPCITLEHVEAMLIALIPKFDETIATEVGEISQQIKDKKWLVTDVDISPKMEVKPTLLEFSEDASDSDTVKSLLQYSLDNFDADVKSIQHLLAAKSSNFMSIVKAINSEIYDFITSGEICDHRLRIALALTCIYSRVGVSIADNRHFLLPHVGHVGEMNRMNFDVDTLKVVLSRTLVFDRQDAFVCLEAIKYVRVSGDDTKTLSWNDSNSSEPIVKHINVGCFTHSVVHSVMFSYLISDVSNYGTSGTSGTEDALQTVSYDCLTSLADYKTLSWISRSQLVVRDAQSSCKDKARKRKTTNLHKIVTVSNMFQNSNTRSQTGTCSRGYEIHCS